MSDTTKQKHAYSANDKTIIHYSARLTFENLAVIRGHLHILVGTALPVSLPPQSVYVR